MRDQVGDGNRVKVWKRVSIYVSSSKYFVFLPDTHIPVYFPVCDRGGKRIVPIPGRKIFA
jgi:hypothetical protein